MQLIKFMNSLIIGILLSLVGHLSQHFLLQKTFQATVTALAPSDTVYFLRSVPKGIHNSLESLGIFNIEEAGVCENNQILYLHPPKTTNIRCQETSSFLSNTAVIQLPNTDPKTSLYVVANMKKILKLDVILFLFGAILAFFILGYLERKRALQERLIVEAEIGRIVGQIGHDIRGPIGALRAVPELIGPTNIEANQIIKIVIERLTSISNEILGSFRKIKLDIKLTSLVEVFLSVEYLIGPRLSKETEADPALVLTPERRLAPLPDLPQSR